MIILSFFKRENNLRLRSSPQQKRVAPQPYTFSLYPLSLLIKEKNALINLFDILLNCHGHTRCIWRRCRNIQDKSMIQ